MNQQNLWKNVFLKKTACKTKLCTDWLKKCDQRLVRTEPRTSPGRSGSAFPNAEHPGLLQNITSSCGQQEPTVFGRVSGWWLQLDRDTPGAKADMCSFPGWSRWRKEERNGEEPSLGTLCSSVSVKGQESRAQRQGAWSEVRSTYCTLLRCLAMLGALWLSPCDMQLFLKVYYSCVSFSWLGFLGFVLLFSPKEIRQFPVFGKVRQNLIRRQDVA